MSTTATCPAGPAADPRAVSNWLVARRNAGATPPEITSDLIDSGWPADQAASAAIRSLRRNDRQGLLWFAQCWSAGLGAVGFTTGVHQLLSADVDRPLAALALTVFLVMSPIAVLCGWHARRVEASSEFAVWSPDRECWFGILATCTAVVGLVRLIGYVYTVVSSLIAPAGTMPLDGRDLAQVMVSLSVAVPLFVWSFAQWRRSNVAISGLRSSEAS